MQDLLETQMGMKLPGMQQASARPSQERLSYRLPGAHLPERGFYHVKRGQPSPQQQKPPSYWSQLSSRLISKPLIVSQNSLSSHASTGLVGGRDASLGGLQQGVVAVDIPEAGAAVQSDSG